MFQIIFTAKSEKQLSKFEVSVQERILTSIERARIRPADYFIRLVGEGLYKLRVGDYRVLAKIDNGALVILVIKIGHLREIYKNR